MAQGLSRDEQWLFEQIYAGKNAAFATNTIIDSGVLRDHILELDEQGRSAGQRGSLRWVIENAEFSEQVDLSDGRRAGGGALPAIEFHLCKFHAGFCADGAQLDRLMFRDCLFVADETAELAESFGKVERVPTNPGQRRDLKNRIGLRNCRIATELRIDGLQPQDFEGKAGLLIVDAFGASVGTNVIVQNTTLRAPLGESSTTLPEPHYALDLSTADIGGDLQLMPRVVLEGGLKMRDAHVGGTFWGAGLQTTDGENKESRAKIVKENDTARLGVRLDATEIEGNLVLEVDRSALLRAANKLRMTRKERTQKHAENEKAGAEEGKDAIVAKKENFDLNDFVKPFMFRSAGEVSIRNVRVGGDLSLRSAIVDGDLTLSNVNVRGNVWGQEIGLIGLLPVPIEKEPRVLLSVDGVIWLNNCHVGGDCSLSARANQITLTGGALEGSAEFKGSVRYFEGSGVTVAGDITVACVDMSECNLTGAKIAGKLDFVRTKFLEEKKTNLTLTLRDAEVKGSIDFATQVLRPIGVRRTKLKCYPTFYLSEVLLPAWEEGETRERIACFLTSDRPAPGKGMRYKPTVLNGNSEQLHRLNRGELTLVNRDGSEEETKVESLLSLKNEEEAREYLKLFCAFVWGELGSFSLMTEKRDLPNGMPVEAELLRIDCRMKEKNGESVWEMRAYVRYSNLAFIATFHLTRKGLVEMVEDVPAGPYEGLDADLLSKFAAPYRLLPKRTNLTPDVYREYRSDFDGSIRISNDKREREQAIERFEEEATAWATLLNLEGLASVAVDLKNASCKTLNDNAAQVWKTTARPVELEGFDYHAVEIPSGSELDVEIESRLEWVRGSNARPESKWRAGGYFLLTLLLLPLNLLLLPLTLLLLLVFRIVLPRLVPRWKRTKSNRSISQFRAQPYTHLAKILRERGDDEAARKVEAEKLWQGAVERARSTLTGKLFQTYWWRPYGVMFGYGLSPLRAAVSLLLIWLLGWACVSMLSRNEMLQASVTKVAPAALVQKGHPATAVVPAGTQVVPPNFPCGEAIEPGLYSFELLTPVLNLHQESRCDIRTKPADESGDGQSRKPEKNSLKVFNRDVWVPEFLTRGEFWEYAKALYMLVGSVVSSLALLTFSGIARRWEH